MGRPLRQLRLSGSAEVGKSTSATLICKELGFTYIEMNASDTRSKKTLKEHISLSMNNETMDGLLTDCQISVRFGMTLILLKMLYSFSCLTGLIFHYGQFIIINWVGNVNWPPSTSSIHCYLCLIYKLTWNSIINDYQYMHYWYLEKLAFQLVLEIIKIYLTFLCQWW